MKAVNLELVQVGRLFTDDVGIHTQFLELGDLGMHPSLGLWEPDGTEIENSGFFQVPRASKRLLVTNSPQSKFFTSIKSVFS